MSGQVGILVRAMNGAQKLHRFRVPDSGWSERWSPDPLLLDVWCAIHHGPGGVTVEVECSRSSVVIGEHVGGLVEIASIDVLGMSRTTSIQVDRLFPAGRALCFRMGAALPMVPDWMARRTQYGPLWLRLPQVDANHYETLYEERLAGLAAAKRAKGQFVGEDTYDGICTPWVGPWGFWGPADVMAPGGSGVTHATGYQASPAFAVYACEASLLAMHRMFFAYKRSDGTPVCVEDYGAHSPNFDTDSADGFRLPEFAGIPRDDLVQPIALSHAIRVFRLLIAAAEMTDSRLARRHIRLFAEQMRLQFSDTAIPEVSPAWTSRQLSSKLVVAAGARNTGAASVGRREGWCMWIAGEYLKLFGPNPGWIRWGNAVLQLYALNAMPNGCSNAHEDAPQWGPVGTKSTQVFEEAIHGLGLLALCKGLGVGLVSVDALRPAVELYLNGTMPVGAYHGQYGPLHYAYTVVNGVVQPQLMAGKGNDPDNPGDPAHVETYLAACAAMTNDPMWLDVSLDYGNKAWDLAAKRNNLEAQSTDELAMNWSAYLLAALQQRA